MSKKIIVDIGLNTSDIAKGAKDGERALERLDDAVADAARSGRDLDGIETALKDVDRQAGLTERSVESIEDATRTTGRDGARDIDDLEASLRDVQRQSERTERAVDDIGDGGQRGFGRAAEGAQELQREIGTNLGESVSSFRGDMSDLGQVGQDTLGGLAATLAGAGPAGMVGAAGLAAAAIGVGGLVGSIQEADEAAKELKKRASEIASEWVTAGQQIIDAQALTSSIQSIIGDEEQLKNADKLVEKLGVELPDAIRILAGDQTALNDIEDEYKQKLQERDELEAMIDDNRGKASAQTREQRKALREWIETYEKEAGVFSTASDLFGAGTQAQSDSLEAYIRRAGEASVQTDVFGNKLYELPDGKKIVVDADTGKATLDLEEFRGDTERIPKTVESTVKFNVDDSAVRNYRPDPKYATVQYTAYTTRTVQSG